MTKSEIISNARNELGDSGITYYSSNDLADSFDDGYREVAILTEVIERSGSFSLVANRIYYNLYETFNDYLRPFAIWNADINDWLSHKDLAFFRKQRYDWEKHNDTSRYFSKIDFQYIALFPHKSTVSSETLEIFYKAVPTLPILMESTPEIPEHFQIVLQYYMMADLFAQSEEYTKSSLYLKRYSDKLNELKVYVNNRSFPDRIHMLREQFSGGSHYGR